MFRFTAITRLAPSAILLNRGKVVSWMHGRGFGFIQDADDQRQHFVHFSALQTETGGFRALSVGQEVEFQVSNQDGRTRAENVTAPGGDKLPSGPRPPDTQMGRGGGGGGGGGGGNWRPYNRGNFTPNRGGGGGYYNNGPGNYGNQGYPGQQGGGGTAGSGGGGGNFGNQGGAGGNFNDEF